MQRNYADADLVETLCWCDGSMLLHWLLVGQIRIRCCSGLCWEVVYAILLGTMDVAKRGVATTNIFKERAKVMLSWVFVQGAGPEILEIRSTGRHNCHLCLCFVGLFW